MYKFGSIKITSSFKNWETLTKGENVIVEGSQEATMKGFKKKLADL
jgi:hypothetical protein